MKLSFSGSFWNLLAKINFLLIEAISNVRWNNSLWTRFKNGSAIIKHRAGQGILCRMQCKVYAFHCFSACANVFPPLGILYALPRRFSTASCPPPSPPTKEKDVERGWSRWKVVGGRVGGRGGYGWRGWVKMMLGWCEGGARLERWWNEGWGVEKVIKNWYQVQGYIYCIYSDPLRDPLLGILSFPFHFPAAFSLLSPSPPFYMSISAQYPHSSFRKES